MNSRERVKRAIHFQGVDHIPHYLPDGEENDLLWLWTPRIPDPQPWTEAADGMERRLDAWGVTWVRPAGAANHGEKCVLPISDILHQADYTMPDQNNPKFFEEARRAITANNASENPKYCLGVMPFSSLNEGTHNLLGLDNMFIAYYEEPEHSCGYILPLLPKLKEWGLNVIQQDQQENQGLENLDAAVGGELAFWCPVDVQKTMVEGSVNDIRAYVRRMVSTLGNHQGGLISMAYSTPEAVGHDPVKTAAMCAAFREQGLFP